ncbi:MAG: phosphoserine phosphatase SerB [Candidatus Altiarchaeota archaeon]|nr:phosphoserine phosphatase SerB [Candidatus Altiarchaeota archaeon]
MRKIKLIAFDLDGVLVDGQGSWWEVHKALGTLESSREHAKEYYSGKITFDEWARKDVKLWDGVEIEKIRDALYDIKLMNGINDTLSQLKKNYKLVIISGGLQILADRIKEQFKMDHAVANKLKVKDGRVCGVNQIVDFQGKGKILEEIAERYGLTAEDCAAVGDYSNDIPMFQAAGFSIAFNPKDTEIIKFADKIVYEKDLRRILPYLNGK